jgi:hypothetical protein
MTIQITDRQLIQRIQRIANREHREPQDVIDAALTTYEGRTSARSSRPFLLAVSDLGASGQGDVAERDEEILAAETDPLTGWERPDDGTS